MDSFYELLNSSASEHGHLCPGQVVGVRMALLGLRLLNFSAPPSYEELKRLIVFVEIDRCTADAVAHVTGAKLGRRSLKYLDYGIMAATFADLETKKAFRIISTEEARDLVDLYAPLPANRRERQMAAYQAMPDSVLFRVQRVEVNLSDYDLPGPTRRKVICARCGQAVRDHKEVTRAGRILCRPCAAGAYFDHAEEMTWPDMNWSPEQGKNKTLSTQGS